MSKHSKEPWRESGGEDNRYAAIVSDKGASDSMGRDKESRKYYGGCLVGESIGPTDRRRIIACVNVLAGVPTEAIEILLRHGRRLEMHADEFNGNATTVAWVSEAPL